MDNCYLLEQRAPNGHQNVSYQMEYIWSGNICAAGIILRLNLNDNCNVFRAVLHTEKYKIPYFCFECFPLHQFMHFQLSNAKGHGSYCHHFESVVHQCCHQHFIFELSPLKLLDQLNWNQTLQSDVWESFYRNPYVVQRKTWLPWSIFLVLQ